MKPAEVLGFWFDTLPADRRFARDDDVDAAIRVRFGALHDALAARVPADWLATPDGRRAGIIVLDQFSRNRYRDDPRAFAQDAAARAVMATALAAGDDADLDATARQFLYMPLMHSEDLADQARSLALFATLGDADVLSFAQRHHDVVARFGRFPARNAALGRETMPDEAAYLREHPEGF